MIEYDDMLCGSEIKISNWIYECQLGINHRGRHRHDTTRMTPNNERGLRYTITWRLNRK